MVGLLLLALLTFGGIGAPAVAQDSEASALEKARQHMEQGQTLFLGGKYRQAAAEFEKAWTVKPFAAFLYNMALAYEKAPEKEMAAAAYERYLTAEPNSEDAAAVREKIRSLRGEPVVQPDTPDQPALIRKDKEDLKALLSVETEPRGAKVTLSLDGKEVASGLSPYAQTLDEADYEIRIEHPDYRTVTEKVRIRPGKVYVIIVEMSQGQFLGHLRVVTSPEDAKVYIDDRAAGDVGQTPFYSTVTAGSHHIWIERSGYQPVEKDIELSVGQELLLRMDLKRVTYGRIQVTGTPKGADVLVDGNVVGQVPYLGDVEAGTHTIAVSADGLKTWSQEMEINRGQLTPIQVRLKAKQPRGAAWATGVMSLLLVGGGVTLGILAKNIRTDLELEQQRGTLSSNDRRFFQGKAMAVGANIAFGIAGIMGILTIYYFLRDNVPDSEATVKRPRDWAFMPSFDLNRRAFSAHASWSF